MDKLTNQEHPKCPECREYGYKLSFWLCNRCDGNNNFAAKFPVEKEDDYDVLVLFHKKNGVDEIHHATEVKENEWELKQILW